MPNEMTDRDLIAREINKTSALLDQIHSNGAVLREMEGYATALTCRWSGPRRCSGLWDRRALAKEMTGWQSTRSRKH